MKFPKVYTAPRVHSLAAKSRTAWGGTCDNEGFSASNACTGSGVSAMEGCTPSGITPAGPCTTGYSAS